MSKGRRAVGAVVVCGGLIALAAPRVGEGDRSEMLAMSAVRAVVSAETVYAAAAGGRYATLECLGNQACLPASLRQTQLLEPGLATLADRHGYRFTFHPQPAASSDPAPLTRFAIVGVPATPETARYRGFCSDDRQVIYVTAPGVTPLVAQGRCVETQSVVGSR